MIIKNAFTPLPLGAVQPRGFLRRQLELMRKGITGNMPRYRDYNPLTSRWLGAAEGDDWENGVYYLRGIVALGFALGDDKLKSLAQTWVDAIAASAREDGYFGPPQNDDWWPRMPALWALRDWFEATGDERIIPLMERYFAYQLANLPSRPLRDWGAARGADNIDIVLWLYDINEDESLLELARLLRSQTLDWTTEYNDTTARQHVVNTSQGEKFGPVCYRLSGDEHDKTAFLQGLRNVMIDHGRIDGLPNSDEAARDNSSTRGSELCGIVEGLLSAETALRVFGEGEYGDYIEKLAYNALPNGYTYDYSSHCYYILQNQVMATHGVHGFDCDHGDSSAFGNPAGYDCCFANNHMGWAKFVQHMFMQTERGLAVCLYGPSELRVRLGDDLISFTQETEYPFKSRVKLTYTGDSANFALKLRVSAWSKQTKIIVNEAETTTDQTGFFELSRNWYAGDVIELEFSQETKISGWYRGSKAVERGALIYCLPIKEKWVENYSNAAREIKVAPKADIPMKEVFPASRWNYGLVSVGEAQELDICDEPFRPENAPVRIKAVGQVIPSWLLEGNKAAPQPLHTAANAELQEEIELVPYACTRLKITHLPSVASPSFVRPRVGSKKLKFAAGENIILPFAEDYIIKTKGRAVVNHKAGMNDLARAAELGLSEAFAFNYLHYNHVSADCEVEVVPAVIRIVKAIPAFECAQLEFTRVKGAESYTIHAHKNCAGGESGTVFGISQNMYKNGECFENERFTFCGLSEGEWVFCVAAVFGGDEVCVSEECRVVV